MDAGAKRWLYATARKNYWRIANWYDLDDLIQEGFCCYAKVKQRYPQATDAPHVMRLFQRTFLNHITNLARHKRRSLETVALDDAIAATAPQPRMIDECLAEMPDVLRRLVVAIDRNPAKWRAKMRVRLDGTRETVNERLCSIMGLDNRSNNLHKMLCDYLK